MADLELGVSAVGVDQVVADLAKVDKAQIKVADAAKKSGDATKRSARDVASALGSTGAAAQRAGTSVGQMGERIGSAASAVGSLSSALGSSSGGAAAGLIGALGGAVAQASALGATLGPAGIVVGGVLALTPIIAQLAGEQRDAAEAAREHAEALRSQAAQMLAVRRAESVRRGIREGTVGEDVSSEQIAVEAEQRRQEILRLERRAAELAGGPSGRMFAAVSGARIEQLRQEIDLLDEEARRREAVSDATREQQDEARRLAAAQTEQAAEQERHQEEFRQRMADIAAYNEAQQQRAREAARRDEERRREFTRNLLGAATAGIARGETLGTVDMQAEFELGENKRFEEMEAQKALLNEAAEAARDLADAQNELKWAAYDAASEFATGWTSSVEQVVEAWREANEAAARAGTGMIGSGRLVERSLVAVGNNIAETVGEKMKGAFEEALSAWMDGAESFEKAAEKMAHGVIKALVIESIVQAAVELARGVTALAGIATAAEAPGHFAAAAAWAAVAGVAGGIGAGIGAFGADAPTGANAGKTDSRALAAGSVQERERTENITINVYPGGYLTRDEVAHGVMDAIDHAGRSGRRLDRRAIPRMA